MTSRLLDAASVTTAALIATASTAYGGEGLIADNVRDGQGWFESSVLFAPILFVVAAIIALMLVSVTDGFATRDAKAIRFARNTVSALGVIGALTAGAV